MNRDSSSEGLIQYSSRSGPARDSNSLIVVGRLARTRRDKVAKESSEVAVRIIFQLSRPSGRVGLLVDRIHCGVAVRKLGNLNGYSTDVPRRSASNRVESKLRISVMPFYAVTILVKIRR